MLHYAAPPIIGGVETTIYHHARLLVEAGFEVDIIAGVGEPFHPRVGVNVVPEVGSRHQAVLSVGRELRDGRVSTTFTALRDLLTRRLQELLAGVEVCIVHNALTLHKNLALTAALYEINRMGVARIIAWSHDFAWQDQLYTLELHEGYPWDLLRIPWPGVQYVVVSEHRRSELATLMGLPETQIRVINPGVDVRQFLKLEAETWRLVDELDLLSARPLILLPARVTRRKNIALAIQIIAYLKTHTARPRLIVTGPPGPHNPTNVAYLAELRAITEALQVAEDVIFLYQHGWGDEPLHVSDAMMSDFYQLADCLLFPSRYEGFGIPVLEAALARLPVFASDIPPIRESADGLAYLFELERSPAQIARDIAETLNQNPQYQLRQRVKQSYTWHAKVFEELIPLLQED
mgnify:CR=1 FL=1